MTTLGEVLDSIRSYYLDRFREAIEEYEVDPAQQVIAEAALLDESGEVVRDPEGPFRLGIRGDVTVLRDGECIDRLNIDTENMLSFDTIEFTWEGSLRVQLAPFQWNMCPFALAPAPPLERLKALTSWFERWFEESEDTEPPFFGCVHYLSDPEEEDGECRLALDLGSAPTEAFEELLDACRATGATLVRFGEAEQAERAASEEQATRSGAPARRSRRSRGRSRRRR